MSFRSGFDLGHGLGTPCLTFLSIWYFKLNSLGSWDSFAGSATDGSDAGQTISPIKAEDLLSFDTTGKFRGASKRISGTTFQPEPSDTPTSGGLQPLSPIGLSETSTDNASSVVSPTQDVPSIPEQIQVAQEWIPDKSLTFDRMLAVSEKGDPTAEFIRNKHGHIFKKRGEPIFILYYSQASRMLMRRAKSQSAREFFGPIWWKEPLQQEEVERLIKPVASCRDAFYRYHGPSGQDL